MELVELAERARSQLQSLTPLKVSGVIGACKKDGGWCVTIELVEREAIPDAQNLLGVYQVLLDDRGQMISYERTRVRRKVDQETLE